MIADLKPYPSMKDSGVQWLGEVPSHWTLLRGRSCYRKKKVPNKGLTETTVLSLSYGHIVVKPPEKLRGLVPASFETYQIIDPGDIIVRPTDLQNDRNSLRFGLSQDRGIITSAYMCLSTEEVVTRPYGYLLLHTYDLKKVFYGLGSGLRQNLDWSDFKYLPLHVPPLPEQAAIARFLDHADERIQRYIRAKQKLITLLQEQKQALIHQAVTGQIDVRTGQPYPAYKPSGVEWLGDVPEHWEVRKLRRTLRAVTERNRSDLPLLSVVREKGVVLRDVSNKDENHNFIPDDLTNYKVVQYGQFAMNKMKAWQGSYGVSKFDGIVSPAYFVFNLEKSINGDYFHTAIRSKAYVPYFTQASDGVRIGQWDLSQVRMRAIPLSVPPLREQTAIVRYLDKATANADSAIDRAYDRIELFREYRTRLIADVVTGKLDVRDAAATLPEVDPLAGDDIDHPVDTDVDSVLEELETVKEVAR